MKERKFGKLPFPVFPVSFGCAAISGEGGGYGFGPILQKEAINLLNLALDLGINVYDCAPIYGFGLAEKRVGMAFASKREKVFLISKCGVTWHESKRVNMTNNPAVAKNMLHQSLSQMRTDYLDLYMIHWPDKQVDIRKTMEVLSEAKREGKIRAIGLCNTTLEDLEKAMEVDRVDVVQSEFNLFRRKPAEELFPYLREKEIGFMSWGTLDKGILSGRVKNEKRKFDPADVRSWAPWWKKEDRGQKFQAMEKIRLMLVEYGYNELQLALGFNLYHPELSTALCGCRTYLQMQEVVESLENLPGEEILNKAVEIMESFDLD